MFHILVGNLVIANQSIQTTNRGEKCGSLEKTNNITPMWLKGLLIGSGVLIAFLIGLGSVMWKRTSAQKTHYSHPSSEPPECPDEQEYSVVWLLPSLN
ncbi:hypothetical protein DPEC_G00154990 [Dallia pectoralis]|uniref:Uncharacterized protein n=1 Tax=Dallia pectoralis TaxID=75939 RepID=A0ACC2GKJ2_DALPE|nr:hypothetical protein DPEC_G00154990 [Dallia pectoralis]